MASRALSGDARITWSGGTFLLAVPLQRVSQQAPRARFEWWALDQRTREVVAIEGGARDVEATIRCDDTPETLLALLRAGIESDEVMGYQYEAGGASIPFVIVAVIGQQDIGLEPDPDRFGFGEWAVRVRLRRTDGGGWEDVL
jgi:hypothetical protein